MSKELQDKADKMIRELKDSLAPIQEEIRLLRISQEEKNFRIIR